MNRKFCFGLIVGGLVVLSSATAAAPAAALGPIPVESFFKQQAIFHPTISHDGLYLTYSALADAYYRDFAVAIAFRNLDTGKINAVETGIYATAFNPRWVANDRIVYGDLSGIDRDGKNYKGLNGFARFGMVISGNPTDLMRMNLGDIIFRRFTGQQAGNILLLAYENTPEDAKPGWLYPNVVNLNTRTADVALVIKNPGKVVGWLPDNNGVIRVGVEHDQGASKAIYRECESAPWHPLPGLERVQPTLGLQGISADERTLYVSLPTPSGTWGLYAYDLPSQKLGEMVAGLDHHDVLRNEIWVDGNSLDQIVFAPKTREMLGVQYVADVPKVVWFDPTLVAVQAALDRGRPGWTNSIVDMSDDLKKFVVLSWSGKDPGTYYLFDLEKKALQPLFAIMPGIKSEQMGEVYPISFKARDGLVVHGYLTVPPGREPKNLPLVVLPYDGPLTRLINNFQRDAQFLASREYAVLQVNYRGSTGYGEEFFARGLGHIGKELQDDISDGTRWAIAQGIADPRRVAIMGTGSFGGYCALMGLIREPDLYRCGIDLGGITDWRSIAKHHPDILAYRSAIGVFGQRENVDLLGDDAQTDASLAEISPITHAAKIKAPLLIVFNKDDLTPTYKQSRFMRDALDKAHKKYETAKFKGEPDALLFNDRVDLFKRIEQFLAANMTP